MDLTNTKNVKFLLSKHNIRPNKRLGQNFLIDKKTVDKLVAAAAIDRGDTVLEVGAGIGTITIELAKRAKRVIAVEKDRALVPILEEMTKDLGNIEIVAGDILKIDWSLVIGHWSLVGNIPYYLTAPLIRLFLESPNSPKSLTLMVQKEMAQRISAKPPNMSILAVSVQVYAKPEIMAYVSPNAFWPQPDVDSAILRITPFSSSQWSVVSGQWFFKIVRAGFRSPRKQLINNLSTGLKISRGQTEQWLVSSGVDPKRRAETLRVEEWLRLAGN